MNNGNVSAVSVFASTKDYTMINIITLKINEMKNLPNLTQCQKNLYCIYRVQVERFSIHSMKHLYSFFFLHSPLNFLTEPKVFTRLIGRKLLILEADTVITKQSSPRTGCQPSLKPKLRTDTPPEHFPLLLLLFLKELICCWNIFSPSTVWAGKQSGSNGFVNIYWLFW